VSVRGLAGYGSAGRHGFIEKIQLPKDRKGFYVRVVYASSVSDATPTARRDKFKLRHVQPLMDGGAEVRGRVLLKTGVVGLRRRFLATVDPSLVRLATLALQGHESWAWMCHAELRRLA
jgi:hypothetical protein